MQVSFDAPVFLCHQFHCKFVCFTLGENNRTTISAQSSGNKPNAFEIMMSAVHKAVLPPPYETSSEQTLRGDHAIYNKLLELLHTENLGWSPDTITSVGGNFVKGLPDCLWSLDPHHKQFTLRACHIPPGFNDWGKKNTRNHKYLKQAHQYTV